MSRLVRRARTRETSDVLQDACLAILRTQQEWLDDPRVCGTIEPIRWLWVRAIGRVKDVDSTYWRRRANGSHLIDPTGSEPDRGDDRRHDPKSFVADDSLPFTTVVEVHDAMEQLKEKQRLAVKAIYFDGMNQEEAAELLGVTQPAVCGLVQRGLKRLKELLS